MSHSLRLLRLSLAGALIAGICAPTHAQTVGLRLLPRGNLVSPDGSIAPVGLRFSLSRYDSSVLDTTLPPPATPLLLSLPQSSSNNRSNALWADWYPFAGGFSSGLRTSAGLVWGDTRRTGNVFDNVDGSRSRAFLGLGWTSGASSSSSGMGWRLDADVGLSVSPTRDCTAGIQCVAPGNAGLKPSSGGDGIRWNPFISIGASFQY